MAVSCPDHPDHPPETHPPGRGLLDAIAGPADLRRLPAAELSALCQQIRDLLIASVARTGGHLGPNLGMVELTVALHRVFDSPREPILFDVGHQAYVHKIVTGRAGRLADLRRGGGLSGYPNRAESPHDWIENSHASAALSYADGLAKAFELGGQPRPVVAVVGDGALTGGMCFEALNNIAAAARPVVVVVNDNGRSYEPTVGAVGELLRAVAAGGRLARLRVLGPVDGHDLAALEAALSEARSGGGPVLVHCRTEKGRGYGPARQRPADLMHQTPPFDPASGRPRAATRRWTDVFGEHLLELGARRPDVVAVTAAMRHPTGLAAFGDRYPERCFDVGIAEQHAVASAAGLALGGLHPVVALYATFATRALDQFLMDVALHGLPVTLVLDRAGLTGEDGPSHHGMWDLALFGAVPGLRIAAPRDAATLRAELDEAVEIAAPTLLRFPKKAAGPEIPAVRAAAGGDVLHEPGRGEVDVLLVAVGATAPAALEAAAALHRAGLGCRVLDPRWVAPIGDGLIGEAGRASLVVTVEDGLADGGVGSRLAHRLRSAGRDGPVRSIGLPHRFIPHGAVAELATACGLGGAEIAGRVVHWWSDATSGVGRGRALAGAGARAGYR